MEARSPHWTRYHKAKKLAWDPQDIDLAPDLRDWAAFSDEGRDAPSGPARCFWAAKRPSPATSRP